MSATIRGARRDDLPGIYRLLDAAFTDAPLSLFVAQTEGDSTLRYRHARIAADADGVAAHVRIFARRMLVRGVPVPAGGIGSVASLPQARGHGYASALLRDADVEMRRLGMPVAFLFTGIPAFYERLGWHVVQQPAFDWDASESAHLATERRHTLRRITEADIPALLTIYRAATATTTGALARTPATWRDAQQWLAEDPAGCLVAEHDGRPRAYIRSRSRPYGYEILEAECQPGHEAAIPALLAAASERAVAINQAMLTVAPADSTLAITLRSLESFRETLDVRYPIMMKIVDLPLLIERLLTHLRQRAAEHAGTMFTLGLTAEHGRLLTLNVQPASVRVTRKEPQYLLDERSTLMTLLGQHPARRLVRPRPPVDVARRLDALLPVSPLHFWSSDRI